MLYDAIWLWWLQEYGLVYLDVESPLSMRPDAHLQHLSMKHDCYAYCIPGPLDHVVRLLYNVLRLLQKHSSAPS